MSLGKLEASIDPPQQAAHRRLAMPIDSTKGFLAWRMMRGRSLRR